MSFYSKAPAERPLYVEDDAGNVRFDPLAVEWMCQYNLAPLEERLELGFQYTFKESERGVLDEKAFGETNGPRRLDAPSAAVATRPLRRLQENSDPTRLEVLRENLQYDLRQGLQNFNVADFDMYINSNAETFGESTLAETADSAAQPESAGTGLMSTNHAGMSCRVNSFVA